MAEVIKMPRMSDTMEVGIIVEWHKNVGDTVSSGDLLAEVETDKATMELESYQEGFLLYRGVEKGGEVPVNAVLAVLGEKGEDYQAALDAAKAEEEAEKQEEPATEPAPAPSPNPAPAPSPSPAPVAVATAPAPSFTNGTGNGRIKASPLAKKMAAERGIDIAAVQGTGEEGRIVKRDIENFQPSTTNGAALAQQAVKITLPTFVGQESSHAVPNSQMRKTIAKRLGQSKFTSPHFYLTMEIDMDECMNARASMNEISPVKISYNDIIVKAVAMSLKQHPQVNASWTDDAINYHDHVHVGVAVAVDEGLVVPVIRFTDGKSLAYISAETRELAGKARDKKIQPEEMQGNTFTISNLGMFDIDEFTAIINPPDACIMAVGKINQVPVVRNGEVVPGNIMKVTLSCDHRVVDGAVGAKFLQTFKQFMENPVRLLV